MDDDKEKLVIDELVDTVKGAAGDAAKAAVMPLLIRRPSPTQKELLKRPTSRFTLAVMPR